MDSRWDKRQMPDLDGKLAVITGANSGIGWEAALGLAEHRAKVVLAVRDIAKGEAAAAAIRQQVHSGTAAVEVMRIDLASQASIRDFAAALAARYDKLPLLINNAGVMSPPYRQTVDGAELQFGTNHLGHFLLTANLLPLLHAAAGARVVTVSSSAHRSGNIDFSNLDGSRGYRRWAFYSQSKLANLLFAREFQRRLSSAGWDVRSIACHPGFAGTNLVAAGLGVGSPVVGRVLGRFSQWIGQSAAMGALPTLYAATELTLQGGEYIGPVTASGRSHLRGGYPGLASSTARSQDEALAARLWEVSEALTGARFDLQPTTADMQPTTANLQSTAAMTEQHS